MPIASYKPDVSDPSTTPNLPTTEPENYKSIIYDDKNQPLHSLISYISGNKWTVDFYSQVVSKDNDLRDIDPGQPDVLQQYQEIKQLELRVSSSLSSNYDSESGITTVSGTSSIYPFLQPNISDYFITETNDNRKALFKITNVERLTFNRDSVYSVDYDLVGYIDDVEALYDELISKVIRTYYFSKDRLVEGLSPILKTEDYQHLTSLRDEYVKLVRKYMDAFYQTRYSTLVLPGQTQVIYDSFIVNYLLKIVNSTDHLDIPNIKKINTDQEAYLKQPQFWELMLHRDEYLFTEVNKQMGLVSKHVFNNNSYLHEFRYTNLDSIVYPVIIDSSSAIDGDAEPKSTSTIEDIIEADSRTDTIGNLISGTYVTDTATYQDIHLVTIDDHYVLSQHFYDGDLNMSLLEILTKDYIDKASINLDMLSHLVSKYSTWGRLEQFYYGPILLTLILEADRSTYS